MAFTVTAASKLAEIELYPSGTLTYYHLTATAAGGPTAQFTLAEMLVGINTYVYSESGEAGSLVDAYDAGGATAESGAGVGLTITVQSGTSGAGISFRQSTDGADTSIANVVGLEYVVGIRD